MNDQPRIEPRRGYVRYFNEYFNPRTGGRAHMRGENTVNLNAETPRPDLASGPQRPAQAAQAGKARGAHRRPRSGLRDPVPDVLGTE